MKITLNKFFIAIILWVGCENVFLGNTNKNYSKKVLYYNSPPDSTLTDSLKSNDFNSYIRRESLNPDSILLKQEKFNALPDSLKSLYEK